MRILSFHQPYATFAVLGIKTRETRNWRPASPLVFSEPLGIHATASIPGYCRRDEHLNRLMDKYGLSWSKDLPLGSILGSVWLGPTLTTTEWLAQYGSHDQMPDEYYLGDYRPNRYAWQLYDPRQFTLPVPAKGSQCFWHYDVPQLIGYKPKSLVIPQLQSIH